MLISGLISVAPVLASQKSPMDAVVIMDSSGSMKKTDPRELRKPAARIFINLLGSEDRLSVMSFSDNAYPITFLTPLDNEQNKDRSLNATDRVSSKGIHTNIYAAIKRGIEMLKESRSDERESILVLLSDGKLDVGDEAQSAELRMRIMQELIPILKQEKIKIYSIAFTSESDQQLLQEIADATDGRYALAASDDVLHKVFTKIFEQSKEPNMLPLFENSFMVDPSIREITIIANKKARDSKIHLEKPDGERINSTFKHKNLKWFVSDSFDMITLSQPQQGQWKILFSDDDNKAYIVADIKLRSRFEYKDQDNEAELSIQTWFEDANNTVTHNELTSTIKLSLEIESPDGTLETVDFTTADINGYFSTSYKPAQNGIYSAIVTADSKTFQRQQIFSFRASIPEKPVVVEPEKEIAPEPVKAIAVEATPPPVVEEAKESSDVGQAIMIFLIANLVIIFIGFNVYFILKIKKPKHTGEKS